MIQVLLQMMGMVFADPLGENRADKTSGAPRQRRTYDNGSKRAAGRDNGSRRRHCTHIAEYTNKRAFCSSDSFG
ncbi:MAG: hypothetical protein OJF58_003971 [Enhydrobacter sp.]|nr:MAG: hypothetical protein OJF58_003971 [Enhydrobacter sp.]